MRTWEIMRETGEFKRKKDGAILKINKNGTIEFNSEIKLSIFDKWKRIKH